MYATLAADPSTAAAWGWSASDGSLASSSVQSQGSVRSRHEVDIGQGDHQRGGVVQESLLASQAPRGPQVGQLPTQDGVGLRFALCGLGGVDPAGQLDCPAQQPLSRGAVFAGRGQPVEPECPDRLEHAVAGPILEGGVDHGCVDEVGQRASRVAGEAELGGDVFGCGEVDSIGEDRQVPEQLLLVGGEELVGPLEGRAQRPVPGFGCRRAACRAGRARGPGAGRGR